MGKHGHGRLFATIAAFLSAAGFLCSAALPATSDDAAALLEKHRAFVGWEFGDPAFHYVRISGDEEKTANGKPETFAHFTTIRANTVFRTTAQDAKTQFNSDYGYTGRVFWSTDQNGFIRPIIGDAEKAAVSREIVFNEGTAMLPGTFERTEPIDNVQTPVVRVQPQNADAIDLYIDPSTGAYKRFVIDPDGPYQSTFDILSYRDTPNGKKIIGVYKQLATGYTITVANVEFPNSIDPQEFAPPKQTATWNFDPSHTPVPLSLDWYRNKRIYFNAKVNGVEGKFIFDTGAAGIFFTQNFANKLKLKQLNVTTAHGVGGAIATKTALVDTIAIGGNTLSHVVVSYQDVAVDADGMMGFDLLGGTIANVDLDKNALTLYDPSTDLSTLAHGIDTTVDLQRGIPTLPMKMDGRINVNASLDTGNPFFVLFSRDLIYRDHLTMYRHVAIARGLGGYELVECGTIDSLTMEPIHYTGVPACAGTSFTGHDILVGLDFLRHFNLWFDYPRAAMVFEPRATVPDP